MNSDVDSWVCQFWNPLTKTPTQKTLTYKLLQAFIVKSPYKSVQHILYLSHMCSRYSAFRKTQRRLAALLL